LISTYKTTQHHIPEDYNLKGGNVCFAMFPSLMCSISDGNILVNC
jgi:hypothetical protein